MDVSYCGDCKRQTEVVYDHGTGDTVCLECGLVLDQYSVDATAEWRSFSDDNKDPNRVGSASNPLLDDHFLTTSIENPKGTKTTNIINQKILSNSNKSSNNLSSAFDKLCIMSDRLGLVETIQNSGCSLYKQVFCYDNNKTFRPRNLDAVLGACLLVACQLAGLPRTVKEICSVVKDGINDNISKKDVLKAKSTIMKQLAMNNNNVGDEVAGIGRTIRACDIVKRFCSKLKIVDSFVMKAAVEAATKCEVEVDVRRSPVSVAAALIYVVVQLSDDCIRRPLKDIASATNVAESTIKNTYKDLYPHVYKIVPTWYATQAVIHNKLCAP